MKELSWPDRGRLWLRLGIRLVLVSVFLFALARFGPWLLSLFAPFLFAAAVAWMLNPAIKWLHKKLGWSRNFLSLLLILLAFALLFGLLWALTAGLVSEVVELAKDWDSVALSLQGVWERLLNMLAQVMALLPDSVEETMLGLIDSLFQWLETAVPVLLGMIGNRLTGMATRLPSFAVSTIVFVMAAYFLSTEWPSLRYRATNSLPSGPRLFLSQVKRAATAGFGGYLRAQFLLSVGVFFILLFGFMLIQQNYALLLALGLALALAVLDFIPIVGAGTVMVPWAFIDLFTGSFRHAVGLMVVWGIIALFRRVAEPRVLGGQTGLSPILSLVGVYVGMKLAGVLGMILGPILCLVVINVYRSGVLDNVLSDLRLAAADIGAILRGGEKPEEN